MPTLLFSTWRLPAADALAKAARRNGWRVVCLDREPAPETDGEVVFYGGSDVADRVSARFGLALLEPSFDLLARTPYSLRLRTMEFRRYDELSPFNEPTFVKPADVRRKAFDAGLYRDVREARLEEALDPHMPVLVSEPVEWLEEHRCFVLEGQVVAWSSYLRFGRPVWQPYQKGAGTPALPEGANEVTRQLLSAPGLALPPAFVVDVGLIADRGWAVVEYNPAWCSSLLGCDPSRMLAVLERASRSREHLAERDRKWTASEFGALPATRPQNPSWTKGHAGAMT